MSELWPGPPAVVSVNVAVDLLDASASTLGISPAQTAAIAVLAVVGVIYARGQVVPAIGRVGRGVLGRVPRDLGAIFLAAAVAGFILGWRVLPAGVIA